MSTESERKFLHDISGALATAMLLMGSVSEDLTGESTPAQVTPDLLLQISKTCNALEKMKNLIVDRRTVIQSNESQEAR